MTSPTFSDFTGTTSSNTSDPRSYVPVIEPLTMTYRSQPRRLGAISRAPNSKPAATSSAADHAADAAGKHQIRQDPSEPVRS